jgi:hypothetical protein
MPITTTPSGGPQGEFSTYTPIYAQTLSATASSITFSNIPTTYTDLILVCNLFSSGTTYSGIRFNGDTGSNYSLTDLYGDGTGLTSSRQSNITGGGASTTSGTGGNTLTYQINNYSNALTFKTAIGKNSNANTGAVLALSASLWRNTAPISSITLYTGTADSWSIGSTFTLYGIKAAAPAPKATGGDVINTDGVYWYHAFKTTGLFNVTQSLTADYLIVAGGGAGGGNGGSSQGAGGGGAGGYRSATSVSLTAGNTYTALVGAGGSPSLREGTDVSRSGNSSSFNSVTSAGGGHGGQYNLNVSDYITGGNGGSGGGATGTTGMSGGLGNTPSTSPSQGNNGGAGNSSNFLAGGGGGAGAVGNAGSSTTGGAGGAGSNAHSSWLSVTGLGVSGFLAGGGGGGARDGNGGSGGGAGAGNGAGTGNIAATSAISSTGSGGGGSGTNAGAVSQNAGGGGGSGVIIVRYPV